MAASGCTIFPSSPTVGQVFITNGLQYVWDGAKWITNPAPTAGVSTSPGTVTAITAGNGLSGGTITSSGVIALAAPVAVTNGGTGGTTAASGLAGLGGMPIAGDVSGNPAAPGQVGEYQTLDFNWTINTVLTELQPYQPIGQLNLTPGDWEVGAMCGMQEIGFPTSYVTALFTGPTNSFLWFIRGVSAQDLSPCFSPMQAISASPIVITLGLEIVTAGAPNTVAVPGFTHMWGRRMR